MWIKHARQSSERPTLGGGTSDYFGTLLGKNFSNKGVDWKKRFCPQLWTSFLLVFPRKSPSRVGDFQTNAKTHFFEIDLGTRFFGSSAQNDAEWWSYCRKLMHFCMSFWILKLASRCWKKYFTCDGKGAVLKKSPHVFTCLFFATFFCRNPFPQGCR